MADLALVCGVSGGLGPAVARAFAARGDRVVGVSRRGEGPPGVDVRAADLGDPAAVERLWEELEGTPRWLVNVAGGYAGGSVAESEPDSLEHMLRLNLLTAWWSCRAAARRMQGGAIVNVSSRAAVAGSVGSAAYGVSKAGVVRLTEILAAELRPRGVRVNAVMPSLIDTPANRASMSERAMQAAVPPDQIAGTIAWLCSEAAQAVSGAVIPV